VNRKLGTLYPGFPDVEQILCTLLLWNFNLIEV